ncbi:MAG: pitrilysin family protein [Candidatus Riflebacteria bacterium]|nr:pitrilysin family protein [Candidatus Riflebacteria bacterium]
MINRNIRRTLLVTFVAILGLLNGLTASAADIAALTYPPLGPISLPDIEEVKLDNGMRLYLLEDRTLPLIEASVRINGGSYLEPAEKIGLSSLLGELLRSGGTEKWSADELDELLEGIGASAETSSDIIAGSLKLMMLSSQKELAIEVMAEILRRPRFEESRFEQAMVGFKSMISRRNDQADSIGEREFEKVIYGAESAYARHSEYATLKAITREDLKAFHQRVYRPENVQMAIWGDFSRKEVLNLVKKYFGTWEKGKEPLPEFPKVDYSFDKRISVVDLPDARQANAYIGHIGGRLFDEDHPHRIVMNNILGVGFGSRLFNQVRSKAGLCYSVYGVYTANLSYPGIFYNYVATRNETAAKAVRMIIDEIKRFQKEPPTAEELKAAKDRYLNSFVFNFDEKQKVIERLVYYDFFKLPRDFLNKQKEMVEATTAENVLAAANKYLKPDSMRILVVGNQKAFDEPLEKLENGKPELLDVTIPAEN